MSRTLTLLKKTNRSILKAMTAPNYLGVVNGPLQRPLPLKYLIELAMNLFAVKLLFMTPRALQMKQFALSIIEEAVRLEASNFPQ
ncbi:MAG: hypothetical protein QNJ46_33345 [Leptolyngbyaceae cyanobacterium MO_188.B28]|nr:hypothetical protein [Leptolyngbyaceae cyanobacterium MO_188.B28]